MGIIKLINLSYSCIQVYFFRVSYACVYLKPKTEFVLKFVGSTNIVHGQFIRPEAIKISPKGKEATVVGKTFKGFYVEYIIEYNNHRYKMYRLNNEEELEIGSKIKIEIEMREM